MSRSDGIFEQSSHVYESHATGLELECLYLTARGLSVEVTAGRPGYSERHVRRIRQEAANSLEAINAAHAIFLAGQADLFDAFLK